MTRTQIGHEILFDIVATSNGKYHIFQIVVERIILFHLKKQIDVKRNKEKKRCLYIGALPTRNKFI